MYILLHLVIVCIVGMCIMLLCLIIIFSFGRPELSQDRILYLIHTSSIWIYVISRVCLSNHLT